MMTAGVVSPMISYHLRRVRAARVDGPGGPEPAGRAGARSARLTGWIGGGHFCAAAFMRRDDLLGVPVPAKMATIASFIALPTVLP